MALVGVALALAIFAAPPVAVVSLFLWVRRLQQRAGLPRFARWVSYALVGIAGMITIGTLADLIEAVAAMGAPSLDPADRQRILASGIAESTYNGAFALLFVVAGAIWIGFVRWRLSRRPSS